MVLILQFCSKSLVSVSHSLALIIVYVLFEKKKQKGNKVSRQQCVFISGFSGKKAAGYDQTTTNQWITDLISIGIIVLKYSLYFVL